MKTTQIMLVAAFALLLVASPALAQQNVCKGAKPANSPNSMPGGWTLLTPKQIKNNADIQANAQEEAEQRSASTGCTIKSVMVQKACSQIVQGTKYQYMAKAKLLCRGKTKPTTITNTFVVEA